MCRQYFTHFFYGGVIELYDNISDIDVNNNSILVSTKKKNEF